jgi:hypothetical protein
MSDECFVICPIGEAGSPTRRHADQLLKHVIGPTVSRFGYEVTRSDKLDEPGLITSQIIQRLVKAPLLIADLTENNANVFYELAIRHAVHLPVIHMARAGERLPFDISGFRTIFFDLSDLDSVAEGKSALAKQVQNVVGTTFESPVSVALNLQRLEGSANPQDRLVADLLSAFSDLKNELKGLSDQERQFGKSDSRAALHFIQDLRSQLPLSKIIGRVVKLKKQGREWRGFSPFIEEKTPSFYVNDQKQAYFCFASGTNGDLFDWIMRTEKVTFGDAVIRAIALKNEIEATEGLEDDLPF